MSGHTDDIDLDNANVGELAAGVFQLLGRIQCRHEAQEADCNMSDSRCDIATAAEWLERLAELVRELRHRLDFKTRSRLAQSQFEPPEVPYFDSSFSIIENALWYGSEFLSGVAKYAFPGQYRAPLYESPDSWELLVEEIEGNDVNPLQVDHAIHDTVETNRLLDLDLELLSAAAFREAGLVAVEPVPQSDETTNGDGENLVQLARDKMIWEKITTASHKELVLLINGVKKFQGLRAIKDVKAFKKAALRYSHPRRLPRRTFRGEHPWEP